MRGRDREEAEPLSAHNLLGVLAYLCWVQTHPDTFLIYNFFHPFFYPNLVANHTHISPITPCY